MQAQKSAYRGQSDPSAGVSAISTVAGITGAPDAVGEYNSRAMVEHGIYRKNSSVLSTAKQFQINTPSALGFTSVLNSSVPQITAE